MGIKSVLLASHARSSATNAPFFNSRYFVLIATTANICKTLCVLQTVLPICLSIYASIIIEIFLI